MLSHGILPCRNVARIVCFVDHWLERGNSLGLHLSVHFLIIDLHVVVMIFGSTVCICSLLSTTQMLRRIEHHHFSSLSQLCHEHQEQFAELVRIVDKD